MYFLERLTGVFSYAILLIMVCIIISLMKREYNRKILFGYTLILSLMGFLFIPNRGGDLYRLIPIMNGYAQSSVLEILDTAFKSTTPAAVIYLYIIGQFEVDGLLAGVTAFVFFYNVFYIIRKTSFKYNLKSKDIALLVMLFMSTGMFVEVISGIRCMLAFSIIAVCFYKEIEEEKPFRKNILLYVIASLLHTAALGVIAIRMIFLIFESEQKSKKIIKIFTFLFIIISAVISSKYLFIMIDMAYAYITKGTYSYIWEYIIGFIDWILVSIILILTYKYDKKEKNNLSIKNNFKFCLVIHIITSVLFFEYNTFHRFMILNSILSLPLFAHVLCHKKTGKNLRLIFLILSVFMLGIACARGNLSSLKFFVL